MSLFILISQYFFLTREEKIHTSTDLKMGIKYIYTYKYKCFIVILQPRPKPIIVLLWHVFLELIYTQIGSYKIDTTKEKKKINLKSSWVKCRFLLWTLKH